MTKVSEYTRPETGGVTRNEQLGPTCRMTPNSVFHFRGSFLKRAQSHMESCRRVDLLLHGEWGGNWIPRRNALCVTV